MPFGLTSYMIPSEAPTFVTVCFCCLLDMFSAQVFVGSWPKTNTFFLFDHVFHIPQ